MYRLLVVLFLLCPLFGCEDEQGTRIRVLNDTGQQMINLAYSFNFDQEVGTRNRLGIGKRTSYTRFDGADNCSGRTLRADIANFREVNQGPALCTFAAPIAPGKYTLRVFLEASRQDTFLRTELTED